MQIDTVGERITYCRKKVGLTRFTLSTKFQHASFPTLSRWEKNKSKIPGLKIRELIKFFSINGLIVTEEWLLYGIGIEPEFANSIANKLNFDEITLAQFNEMKKYIHNIDMIQVNSKTSEPFVNYGDYIFGQLSIELKELHYELCFCMIDSMVELGIFDYTNNNIVTYKNKKINVLNNEIGKVLWIARRF